MDGSKKESSNKEIWGCIGLVGGALVTGFFTLVVASPTLIAFYTRPTASPIFVPMTETALTSPFDPTWVTMTPTTETAPTSTFDPTSVTTATAVVILPTNTPGSTPELATVATQTAFVLPTDGILFVDDFENGLDKWNKYTGSWIITEGKLSKLREDPYSSLYAWIGIPQPAVKNYIVSLDITEVKSNNYPPIAIVVRQNVAAAKYIGVELDFWPRIYLSLVANDSNKSTAIAGQNKDFTFPTGTSVKVEVEVKDDTYLLRVNGQQLQSVTIAGYDSPEIRIGLHCSNYPGCPTFDNFQVTYLP